MKGAPNSPASKLCNSMRSSLQVTVLTLDSDPTDSSVDHEPDNSGLEPMKVTYSRGNTGFENILRLASRRIKEPGQHSVGPFLRLRSSVGRKSVSSPLWGPLVSDWPPFRTRQTSWFPAYYVRPAHAMPDTHSPLEVPSMRISLFFIHTNSQWLYVTSILIGADLTISKLRQ